ncbi:MAG: biopolymer transporter ExbD [Limnohabitans sp.]|jgi:biopolymer transport protein ExbD|nr:biopolymer transporter ExbD [Limnohabitans sp.]
MAREHSPHSRGRARHDATQYRSRLSLSITPMIDVVFQLLIYFLLTAGLMANERILRSELQVEQQAQPTSDPFALEIEPLVIRVSSIDGGVRLTLSGELPDPTSMDALEQFLRDAMLTPSQPQGLFPADHPIRIAPNAKTRWEHVAGVFNAAMHAGYTSIAFGGANE